jgi:hypothetical protein
LWRKKSIDWDETRTFWIWYLQHHIGGDLEKQKHGQKEEKSLRGNGGIKGKTNQELNQAEESTHPPITASYPQSSRRSPSCLLNPARMTLGTMGAGAPVELQPGGHGRDSQALVGRGRRRKAAPGTARQERQRRSELW